MDSQATESKLSPFERLCASLEIDTRMLAMIGALLIIWFTLNYLTDGIFFTARNLYNLAVQTSVVGIMATGMVLVIVARHIDLSVGSVMGFTGMVIAFLQVHAFTLGAAWNWPLTVVCGLALGALIGIWQGWWVAYRGVPAFVVTLGGLLIFRGAAYLVTDGRTVAPMDETYQLLGGGIHGSIGATGSWIFGALCIAVLLFNAVQGRKRRARFGCKPKAVWAEALILLVSIGLVCGFVMVMNSYYKPKTEIPRGIPIPVLILIGVVVLMTLLAKVTKFGRYVFAIGGNPEAAELSGINVERVTMFIFGVMGLLCGVAAVITTARLNAGANSMGMMAELNVIAAAVIGGTSLAGGLGSIAGAILGALIMQSLESGMVLLGISSAMRQVIIGLVLIIAVWFDVAYNKNRR
ncbi:MAG: sugar ABC transporter permease [Pseudodesulfovibrio sp.]|jgi:D-xylose transport system permease protein|uniref:Xylose transport system permease protein XylH n=1 Tax=Pseudodesulfovibrio indicus TaxID=1716143 RepID=A0A126QRC3_9BACT|nr:sugar ABC transporter permease [Pseudodesulfovibrio indicus]AMK12613.1 sugar ABC transporter permease [Pseudodesulfovibrio indicus]TDT90924.1 D-xylose transport system permease protein [Pseudodesulfovibrio indicus]